MDTSYDALSYEDFEDLEVSEVEVLDDTCATAYAKYCRYSTVEEEYAVVYKYFYLKEIDQDNFIFLRVDLDSLKTTDKTPELLEEISEFYKFDISCDADETKEKIDNYLTYLENDDSEVESFSTGYLNFNMPKGWKRDKNGTFRGPNYNMLMYAPNGDGTSADCVIYMIEAMRHLDAEEDVFQIAEDILANGEFIE